MSPHEKADKKLIFHPTIRNEASAFVANDAFRKAEPFIQTITKSYMKIMY